MNKFIGKSEAKLMVIKQTTTYIFDNSTSQRSNHDNAYLFESPL